MNKLLTLFTQYKTVIAPGVYDPISAKLAEIKGFKALWVSGFCVSTSLFVPDENILTINEFTQKISEIRRVCDLPLIVDCDEGYGNIDNTWRLFEKLSFLNIESCCIEDNIFPKLNSFKNNRDGFLGIQNPYEFSNKIKELKNKFPNILLVARTESLIVGEPLQTAVERAKLYKNAGADFIVIHSRSKDLNQFLNIAQTWGQPATLFTIPTIAENMAASDLSNIGYKVIIYANQLLRSNIFHMNLKLDEIKNDFPLSAINYSITSMDYIFRLIDSHHNKKQAISSEQYH